MTYDENHHKLTADEYAARQDMRRTRIAAAADRAEKAAAEYFDRADMREEKSGIPFGQPILVGHHSARKHRRALERADNAMRKGIEARDKAAALRQRAEGVGSGGIASDDPDAIRKLQAKIDAAQATQADMKAENAAWRKAGNKGGRQPDGSWLRGPYAAFELTNNNANIRRMEKRIAALKAAQAAPARVVEYAGFKVFENPDAMRIQIVFSGKPDSETRKILKHRGFRWAPSQGAWQRHLNNNGRWAAEAVAKELEEETDV